eukprot:UN29619
MLRLCLQSIRKDLGSGNSGFQCLALACVANVALPEFAPTLVKSVIKLLTDKRSPPPVRKKAALCLLRLLRQNPECIPVETAKIQSLIELCEDKNEGVLTSFLSLLIELAKLDGKNYEIAVPKCIGILERFVLRTSGCSRPYMYFRTACPWLVVKCLRFLQFFPPPRITDKLKKILAKVLEQTEVTNSVNKNNADHAILFEAINVITHLNMNGNRMLHQEAIDYLLKFIAVKEPNIRYLGLEAMTRLAKVDDIQESIHIHLEHKNFQTIQYSLDDDDISATSFVGFIVRNNK